VCFGGGGWEVCVFGWLVGWFVWGLGLWDWGVVLCIRLCVMGLGRRKGVCWCGWCWGMDNGVQRPLLVLSTIRWVYAHPPHPTLRHDTHEQLKKIVSN
jgi:hypothetical protein